MNSNGQTENNEDGEDKTKPGIETGIVLYQSDGANVSVEVMYSDETFWMRQKAIAELFGVGLPTISEHLNNIFKSGELEKTSSTTSFDFSERSRLSGRPPVYYNLDAMLEGHGSRKKDCQLDCTREVPRVQQVPGRHVQERFREAARETHGA